MPSASVFRCRRQPVSRWSLRARFHSGAAGKQGPFTLAYQADKVAHALLKGRIGIGCALQRVPGLVDTTVERGQILQELRDDSPHFCICGFAVRPLCEAPREPARAYRI